MTFLYILLAILILMFMVLIHELGHYIAAKIFKFKVVEFSIGFGPKLFQRTSKKTGEKFTLRLIPLGGYCAFESEDEKGELTEKSFYKEKPWKRIIVLLSGAIMNFLSAILFSFIFLVAVGPVSTTSTQVHSVTLNSLGVPYSNFVVGDVITHVNGYELGPDTPISVITQDIAHGEMVDFTVRRGSETITVANRKQWISAATFEGFGFSYTLSSNAAVVNSSFIRAGGEPYTPLLEGDRIVRVNDRAVTSRTPLSELTHNVALGQQANFSVERGSGEEMEKHEFTIFRGFVSPSILGFGFTQIGHNQRFSFPAALLYSVPFAGQMSWAIIGGFGSVISCNAEITDVTGPIGTIGQIATVSQSNWRNILLLLPLLAANLAIFNLLPLPALDGGKVIFTIIEAARKKPINRKIENRIHLVGIMIILGLVLFLDVFGMFCGGGAVAMII